MKKWLPLFAWLFMGVSSFALMGGDCDIEIDDGEIDIDNDDDDFEDWWEDLWD